MPTTTVTVVEGLAFCPDPRCPGYEQVPAAVRVTHAEWSYIELGGDLPGIERAMDYETFALQDGEDIPSCQHCGTRMEATTQVRPEYARVSGQDPLRLLSLDQDTIRRAMQGTQNDQAVELANLRTQLAEMRAEMMQMVLDARSAAAPPPTLEPEPPKRGPGRPRKEPE